MTLYADIPHDADDAIAPCYVPADRDEDDERRGPDPFRATMAEARDALELLALDPSGWYATTSHGAVTLWCLPPLGFGMPAQLDRTLDIACPFDRRELVDAVDGIVNDGTPYGGDL